MTTIDPQIAEWHKNHKQRLYIDRDFGLWTIYCEDCNISIEWGYAGATEDMRDMDRSITVKGGYLIGFKYRLKDGTKRRLGGKFK